MSELTDKQEELEEIKKAMSQIRKAGQSYTIITASGAGTSRTVTMADYKDLLQEKKELEADILNLSSCPVATTVRAGW